MPAFKTPDLTTRNAASRDAKQRALDQLRAKPTPDPEVTAAKQAAKAARDTAAAERRATKQAAAEAAKAAKEAARAAAQPEVIEEAPAPAKPERPKPTAEELKAARDARYAARKARKR